MKSEEEEKGNSIIDILISPEISIPIILGYLGLALIDWRLIIPIMLIHLGIRAGAKRRTEITVAKGVMVTYDKLHADFNMKEIKKSLANNFDELHSQYMKNIRELEELFNQNQQEECLKKKKEN